jgi:hypothetical protein
MSERYKVLGAMLALGDFTVPELTQYSGVSPQTVRTVVSRERRNLKPLGIEAATGRGGRFKRFQVQPAQAEGIRQELNELYRALPRESPVPGQQTESQPVPLAILAAEDVLIRRFPQAGALEERKRLLNLAESVWQRYCSALPEENLPSTARLYLDSLDGLRKLCSAELATTYEPFFSGLAFDRAKESMRVVAAAFKRAGQAEHAAELLDRALASSAGSPSAEIIRSKTMEMSESLEHPEVYVREAAVQAAATAASASNASWKLASDIVTRLQQDGDPVVRRTAAEVLGELIHHDAAVEQALTKAAREDEPAVRLAARKSLAVLEAHSSREAANQALEAV